MNDDFRERAFKYVFPLALLCIGGLWVSSYLKNSRTEAKASAMGDAEERRPSSNDRIKEIHRLHYKDPIKALEIHAQIQKQPKNKEEAKEAAGLLPDLLGSAFNVSLRQTNHAVALKYLKDLTNRFPEHFQSRGAKDSWGRDLGKRARDAIKADQENEADRLVEEIVGGGHLRENTYLFEEIQVYKVDRAVAAKAAGDREKAESYLRQAARFVVDTSWSGKLAGKLREVKWDGAELLAIADKWFDAGQLPRAIPLYTAALQSMGQWPGRKLNYQEEQTLRKRVSERQFQCLIKAGDDALTGSPEMVMLRQPRELYHDAVQAAQEPALRIQAMGKLVATDLQGFQEKAKPVLALRLETMISKQGLEYEAVNAIYSQAHAAQSAFYSMGSQAVSPLWGEMRRQPGFDAWLHADPAIKARAWAEFPNPDQEEARRQLLETSYREANWPLPIEGMAEAGETMCQLLLRWGILSCHSSPSSGLEMLKRALAHSRDPDLKDQVGLGLRAFIRQSRTKKDFDALYEYTVFYTGAFPAIKADDPFRKDLLACLKDASKHFQGRSAMKHIFILSLLNELDPQTADGRGALAEAVRLSFAAAAAQAEDTKGSPVLAACPIAGNSLLAVDNDTEYHILCFYQGPETFFVRIPPYRRGSLLMKSGDYRVAVISTSDKVIPYRGSFGMKDEQRKSVYVIRTSGQGGGTRGFSSSASGQYALMRTLDAAGKPSVDGRTGLLKQ